MVGAGLKTFEQSRRPMQSVIPPQAKWVQAAVKEFHPDSNYVVTADGTRLNYEYLVVALGLQLNFDKVAVYVVRKPLHNLWLGVRVHLTFGGVVVVPILSLASRLSSLRGRSLLHHVTCC